MKAVILAGGLGTRLSEETVVKPKPMVEVGGKPILWHIMKTYSHYGIKEFVICLGYKGYMIKEWFANYFLHNSDVTIDLRTNQRTIHNTYADDWKITLVDTGDSTDTGGRIKKIQKYVDGTFFLTYGDGLADIDIDKLLELHNSKGKHVTVTAVQPPGRFGMLNIQGTDVPSFLEKPRGDGNWINGGYFVLEPAIFDYIAGDNIVWEQGPLEKLANDGQLAAYKHEGFWRPMDTLRDKKYLDELWDSGKAPWKVWK
ncbi:glucose-1-phosphate cytidylyltransferase [Candidatus Micrarchaeota archaeon]|nr:glucose-1-phosphate cytidylyltransferase [Candidatus Micrarchaeota archaeon]